MEITIKLTDAKARFSEVVEKASLGDEIIVTRMGKPIAKIVKYEPAKGKKRLGALEGKINIAADFDVWPDDIADAFGIVEDA